MSDLKILENTFTMRKSFNIQEHLQSAFGIYKGLPTKGVCLRFSSEKARWVEGQVWHKDHKMKINKYGSLELSFPVADFAEIMMEILKHGSGVEVVRPKALRDLKREEAKKIARTY
jgi:predicted DNA-binding transcriptional regulator YafY